MAPMAPTAPIFWTLLVSVSLMRVGLCAQEHLPALLLKQAADSLLTSPLDNKEPQYYPPGLPTVEEASPKDLLLRRLQGQLELRVKDNWLSLNDPQRYKIMQTKGAAKQILKSFEKIKSSAWKLEQEADVEGVERVLNNLKLTDEDKDMWVSYWETVRRQVGKIAQLYNFFRVYIEKPETADDNTLKNFATSVVQAAVPGRSLLEMMDKFHETVCPSQSGNRHLFPTLHSLTEEGDHLCSMNTSPHQMLYNLYNIVALTEIKGYAMLQFSYMMLRIYEKGNFTDEANRAKEKFESQATEKMRSIEMVLPRMSRIFYKCDPAQHKEGETFYQITKLLQGYIENEVDMNPRQSCTSQCSSYNYAESKSCYKDLFCAKQPKCNGRIFDCQFYNADAWVCMAEESANRRYEWVEYENGIVLGNRGTCKNKIKVDSWWRYIFYHCSYCLCKCDEITDDSDRFWSLLPATADTANNKVVTGVRFVKIGRIIYPQIEEASALPEGGIDSSSRVWVPPKEISYTDTSNLTANTGAVFTMSYEHRAVDLDALEAPQGHVLTGIKLRTLGGHLNLEIQVTPIKFQTGALFPDRSLWVANDNTPATNNPRTFVPIIMPDIPTRLSGQNKVDSTTDQFIQFDATSAYKDVSQTTIPFIDRQGVSPGPSSWLAGAGLYHKGAVGYGGFLGLSVASYDFSRHLSPGAGAKPVLSVQFVRAEDH